MRGQESRFRNREWVRERERAPSVRISIAHSVGIFAAHCLIKIKFNCALNQTTSLCLPITCRQVMVIGQRASCVFIVVSAFRSSSGDIYLLEYVAYFVICTCNAYISSEHGNMAIEHGKIDRSIDYNRDTEEYPIELTINFYLYRPYVSSIHPAIGTAFTMGQLV